MCIYMNLQNDDHSFHLLTIINNIKTIGKGLLSAVYIYFTIAYGAKTGITSNFDIKNLRHKDAEKFIHGGWFLLNIGAKYYGLLRKVRVYNFPLVYWKHLDPIDFITKRHPGLKPDLIKSNIQGVSFLCNQ